MSFPSPRFKRLRSLSVAACGALALSGCGLAFPPAPPRATSFPAQANLQPSIVAVPVTVRLRNVGRALNRSGSSRVLNTGWQSIKASSTDGYADVRTIVATALNAKVVGSSRVPTEFRITMSRGDVAVGTEGQSNTVRVGFNDRFSIELNSRAGKYICSQDERERVRSVAAVAENLHPDLSLEPKVTNLTSAITTHCNAASALIDRGGVDFTPLVRERYARVLYKVADTLTLIVQKTIEFVVRAKFTLLSRLFAMPIEVSPNVWLTPNLQNAGVRRLTFAASGDDLFANFDIALAARPQVSLGSRPPNSPASAPRFSDLDAPNGFKLPIDVRVPYDTIREKARAELRGKSLPVKVIGTVHIDDVDIYATDAGTPEAPQPKLVVQVDFSGGASGRIFVWGTPTIDPATRIISMPDLAYTAQTRHLLIRAFAPLLTSNLVMSQIRKAATFDAGTLIDEQTAPFLKPYNKTLTLDDGTSVAIDAVPDPLGINGIAVGADALTVHAAVSGMVKAQIDTDIDSIKLLSLKAPQ